MAAHANAYTVYESFKAGSSALTSTAQFKVAYLSAAKTASIMNTSSSIPIGVIVSYPSASTDVISVCTRGICRVYCNDTITAGNPVCADSSGRIIPFSGATASTQHILGLAREAAAATGTYIEVDVNVQYNPYVKV